MDSNKESSRKDGSAIEERKEKGIVDKEGRKEDLGGIAMEENKGRKEKNLKKGRGRK